MSTTSIESKARAIQAELSPLSLKDALLVLSLATHNLAASAPTDTKGQPASVGDPVQKVPRKRKKADRFAQVWDYLATIDEYTTLDQLHAALISRFGEEGTPSRSHLHRYIQERRLPAQEGNQ